MATTIANLTTKPDGSMEGVFATLRVNAPITVIPNTNKSARTLPTTASSTSARASTSEPAGTASPSVGRGIPLGQTGSSRDRRHLRQPRSAPGGEENKKVILWNNPQ